MAESIPNAKIYIIANRLDPFAIIKRDDGAAVETVTFGAWKTGTDMDDV